MVGLGWIGYSIKIQKMSTPEICSFYIQIIMQIMTLSFIT